MSLDLAQELYGVSDLFDEEGALFEEISLEVKDGEKLAKVYENLTKAALLIQEAASLIESSSSDVHPEDIDEVGDLIEGLASSGVPDLAKKASVLENILLTIGASPNSSNTKKAEAEEIESLKKKYKISKDLYAVSEEDKKIKEEYIKDFKKKVKTYKPLEAALSTRHSPNMPGVSLIRIDDDVYQCPVTGDIFDYKNGFTTANGNKVPGSGVENQHQYDESDSGSMFLSTREQRLSDE